MGAMGRYPPIQCRLCPKECRIPEGYAGDCRVRIHLEGKLLAVVYGRPVVWKALDPIEKKPLNHFLPGTGVLSVACVGCNLHCLNCQNWEISQCNPEDQPAYPHALPERVVALAERYRIPSVAATYTEPIAWIEYTLDLFEAARGKGLKTVLVTAGYARREPARELFSRTDAANIDLKAFDDAFYRKICSGTLKPVLDNLVLAKQMDVWLEVTNLVIPTLNDSPKKIRELCRWHVKNLGAETPLHFSAFFPRHRLRNLPPTPASTLLRAREIALEEGLHFVYIGNLRGGEGSDTVCPKCGALLIRRVGYHVEIRALDLDTGKCSRCGEMVPGRWR